jgi:hypothetical protein
VHFVLSQAFAEVHKLGIDTTMTLVEGEEPNKPPVYNYTVGDRVYRTSELMNHDGVKSTLGRGTRVWAVNEVINGKPDPKLSGVLKDHWMDHDRMREVDILAEIIDQEGTSEETREILTQLFLTIIASWDVCINGCRDETRSLMSDSEERPTEVVPFPMQVPASHQPSHVITTHLGTDEPPPTLPVKKIIRYHPKYHVRTVFKEKCNTLWESRSMQEAFWILFLATCGNYCYSNHDLLLTN